VSTDFDAQAETFLRRRRHDVAMGLSSGGVSLYNEQLTDPRRIQEEGEIVLRSLYTSQPDADTL
jgi:hypothetical protein